MPIINISLCIVHVFRGKAFPVIKTLTAKFDSGTVSYSPRKYRQYHFKVYLRSLGRAISGDLGVIFIPKFSGTLRAN